MIALDARLRVSRRARLRFDHARARWILLSPERGMILNQAAAEIVRQLGEGRTVEEIATGTPHRSAVIAFVGELLSRRLVEPA